jgi:hypothetical protein
MIFCAIALSSSLGHDLLDEKPTYDFLSIMLRFGQVFTNANTTPSPAISWGTASFETIRLGWRLLKD